jgi:hypothetical protein
LLTSFVVRYDFADGFTRWVMAGITSVGCFAVLALVLLSGVEPLATALAAPATTSTTSDDIQSIFWENQIWKPGGGGERLMLWADGRSEIIVKRFGKPGDPKPGWTARAAPPFTHYVKSNPLPPQEAKQKFAGAIAAGIDQIKPFEPNYHDGGGTLVGVQRAGEQMKEVTIPEFTADNPAGAPGSENHKRYLAVKQVLDGFDTDAIAPVKP